MDKKNTLLLTVIAVATLLVAVVGATFAYFTAQQGKGASAPVTVTTSTTNSSQFEIDGTINVTANQQNFAQGMGDRKDDVRGKVTFAASNAVENPVDFCYTVDLLVESNDFEYAEGTTTKELTFTIAKRSGADETAAFPTDETELTAALTANAVMSDRDITVEQSTVNIPVSASDASLIHKITSNPGETNYDYWYAKVTLVNLDADQNYNTNKQFKGSLRFAPANCA